MTELACVVICSGGGVAAFLLTVGAFAAVRRLLDAANGLARLARPDPGTRGGRRGLARSLRVLLERVGEGLRTGQVRLSVWQHLAFSGVCAGAGFLVTLAVARSPSTGVGVGALLGFVPGRWFGSRRAAVSRNIGRQLEGAVVGMADALSAGQSLAQALEGVAQQGGPPLAAEFAAALREYEAGMPLLRALERMRDRLPCPEVDYLVQAFDIHARGGGNVVEVLGHLAETLRERRILHGELQAKTAEARLSAWVVALTPVVFTGYLAVGQPESLALVLTDELGKMGLSVGVILWLLGVLTVSRLVRLEESL